MKIILKPVFIIAIAVVCSVVAVLGLITVLQGSTEFLKINEQASFQSPLDITNTSYKYNTICDIGDYDKFLGTETMQTEVMQTVFEIWAGQHNENEKLVKFFKGHKFLGNGNDQITPDLIYPIEKFTGEGLGPNYDPIFYDPMFWIPPALDIMNSSPDLIELFTVKDGDSMNSYVHRLQLEKNKCG